MANWEAVQPATNDFEIIQQNTTSSTFEALIYEQMHRLVYTVKNMDL